MDEMTEYEFEYEFLLDQARKELIQEAMNKAPIQIDPTNQSFSRSFSMDQDEYEHILELAEKGEYIDFEIPKDAPTGKRISESVLGMEKKSINIDESDFEVVDLSQEFGGGKNG
jgi:hypothetical protein